LGSTGNKGGPTSLALFSHPELHLAFKGAQVHEVMEVVERASIGGLSNLAAESAAAMD
jgi:hypothetical protein